MSHQGTSTRSHQNACKTEDRVTHSKVDFEEDEEVEETGAQELGICVFFVGLRLPSNLCAPRIQIALNN